jgi:hypothetical protein
MTTLGSLQKGAATTLAQDCIKTSSGIGFGQSGTGMLVSAAIRAHYVS